VSLSGRSLELAHRHGALRARIDAQRAELARHLWPVEKALAGADRVRDGIDWLKAHPEAVVAVTATVVVVSPKRAWRWGKRGYVLWRGWQAVRKSLLFSR
jgi:membrane protein required for beta-lactamase induction